MVFIYKNKASPHSIYFKVIRPNKYFQMEGSVTIVSNLVSKNTLRGYQESIMTRLNSQGNTILHNFTSSGPAGEEVDNKNMYFPAENLKSVHMT